MLIHLMHNNNMIINIMIQTCTSAPPKGGKREHDLGSRPDEVNM